MSESHRWYFTAPWEPVAIRRGDALGFRAAADHFADLLAPGLSNAASDARWISILSWCLQWSHAAWRSAGGGDLARRDAQHTRYAWLRPLELLWIDRTLASGQTTGQLRGRRSVERWRKAERQPLDFAMTAEQFRRYRQTGTYGAYRVVFRSAPGLTTGDGWTPGVTALALAKLVNDSLPSAARLTQTHFEWATKWGHWSNDNQARYWVEHGWPDAATRTGGVLPTPDEAAHAPLPAAERGLLAPALFAAGSTRRITVETLARARGATSHAELCDALAASHALAHQLAPLPTFSRFADAAMHAMRGLWHALHHDAETPTLAFAALARDPDLQARLAGARAAGDTWLRADRPQFPHDAVISQLAEALHNAATPIDQLRALVRHHHVHGGGRRWFREQTDTLIPLLADTSIPASDYRFRLWPLNRLAAQCDVAAMHPALDASDEEGDDA